MADLAIRKHFEIKLVKNEAYMYSGHCKAEGCPWRFYCRRVPHTPMMQCNVLGGKHNCSFDKEKETNKMATTSRIAKIIEKKMRLHFRSFKTRDVRTIMWKKHQLKIKYHQAWRAKNLALELVHENYEESYAKVGELCRQILAANPGSIAAYSRDDTYKSFTSLCISFKAFTDGFVAGCRPLIGLDGCFLKGKYGGVILNMIALDGNNGLFPLGVFVCKVENQENWTKFLEIMEPLVGRHPEQLTILSDRQKGLINAVKQVFPHAHVRYCMRHLVANMKTRHKGLDSLAWAAAKSYKKSLFRKNMEDLEKKSKKAAEWLMGDKVGGPKVFSRSHFDQTSKSEHVSNNFSEAWNAHILEARDKPLIKLILRIMIMQMKMLYDRRLKSDSWDDEQIVPRVIDELKVMQKKTGEYTIGGSSNDCYQITHIMGGTFRVKLEKRKCSCKEWQMKGFSCVHAVCILKPRRIPYYKYCSPYVLAKAYKASCRESIVPILGEEDWEPIKENEIIFPPIRSRQLGRPRVNRIRSALEDPDRRTVKCSSCGGFGPNRKGCQGGPVGENVPLQPNDNSGVESTRKKGGKPRTRPLQNTNLPPRYEPLENTVRGRGRGRGGARRGRTGGRNATGRGTGAGDGNIDHDQEPSLAEIFGPVIRGRWHGADRGGHVGADRGGHVGVGRGENVGADRGVGRARGGGSVGADRGVGRARGGGRALDRGSEIDAEMFGPSTQPQVVAPSTQPQVEHEPPNKSRKRKTFNPEQALQQKKEALKKKRTKDVNTS